MILSSTIEAILFHYAEPLTVSRLASLLKVSEEEVRDALEELDKRLFSGGTRLVRNRDAMMLGTAPEVSAVIETITKEELSKELSKSAVETLAIVLYKGPLTRTEIDYIRGVNSTFILRNLQVRGLIERTANPKDQRAFLYQPTFRLLESLGVERIESLPRWADVEATLAGFMKEETEQEEERKLTEEPIPPTDARREDIDEEEAADVSDEIETGALFDDNALREHKTNAVAGDEGDLEPSTP